MAKALGQLPNAPLIYVLAQIRFTHVPRMDRRWEDFHEKVFSTYPKAETERIDQFVVKDGQPAIGGGIQRWHLVDKSRNTGIILDAGTFIFHTTDYETSDVFLNNLDKILDAFIQVLPESGVTVNGLGLRYVDLLIAEDDLTVDHQVIESLRLPQLPTGVGKIQRMDQVVTYETPTSGTLTIRHRQSTTPDLLPSDIFPTRLEPAARLSRARPKKTIVGLLDYDHHVIQDYMFDSAVIVDKFRELHGVTSVAFKKTTTEEAHAAWENEVQ